MLFLDGRQHRERFARGPQPQRILMRRFLREPIDPRRRRSLPAGRNHVGDDALIPFEYGFDAAVAAISHPALQAAPPRFVIDPGAVADALHPATYRDAADGDGHRFALRNSATRIFTSASRITFAVRSADARPVKAFGAVPSRNALSVA